MHKVGVQLASLPGVPKKCKERVQYFEQGRAYEKKASIMSMVDNFANQPISDSLIDELALLRTENDLQLGTHFLQGDHFKLSHTLA